MPQSLRIPSTHPGNMEISAQPMARCIDLHTLSGNKLVFNVLEIRARVSKMEQTLFFFFFILEGQLVNTSRGQHRSSPLHLTGRLQHPVKEIRAHRTRDVSSLFLLAGLRRRHKYNQCHLEQGTKGRRTHKPGLMTPAGPITHQQVF